jgi:hypothetical protein
MTKRTVRDVAISVDLSMLGLADSVSPSREGIKDSIDFEGGRCLVADVFLFRAFFLAQYSWPFESLSTSTFPAKERYT